MKGKRSWPCALESQHPCCCIICYPTKDYCVWAQQVLLSYLAAEHTDCNMLAAAAAVLTVAVVVAGIAPADHSWVGHKHHAVAALAACKDCWEVAHTAVGVGVADGNTGAWGVGNGGGWGPEDCILLVVGMPEVHPAQLPAMNTDLVTFLGLWERLGCVHSDRNALPTTIAVMSNKGTVCQRGKNRSFCSHTLHNRMDQIA